MPDIDVFAGIHDLATAANPGQPVDGLPNKDQYQYWLKDQNDVEKEMEAFDAGKH